MNGSINNVTTKNANKTMDSTQPLAQDKGTSFFSCRTVSKFNSIKSYISIAVVAVVGGILFPVTGIISAVKTYMKCKNDNLNVSSPLLCGVMDGLSNIPIIGIFPTIIYSNLVKGEEKLECSKCHLRLSQVPFLKSAWTAGELYHDLIKKDSNSKNKEAKEAGKDNPEHVVTNSESVIEEAEDAIETPGDVIEEAEDAIKTPSDVTEEAGSAIKTPSDVTEEAEGAIKTPSDVTEEAEGAIKTPSDVTEEAEGAIETPSDVIEEAEGAIETPSDVIEEDESTVENLDVLVKNVTCVAHDNTEMTSDNTNHQNYEKLLNSWRNTDNTNALKTPTTVAKVTNTGFVHEKVQNWETRDDNIHVNTEPKSEVKLETNPTKKKKMGKKQKKKMEMEMEKAESDKGHVNVKQAIADIESEKWQTSSHVAPKDITKKKTRFSALKSIFAGKKKKKKKKKTSTMQAGIKALSNAKTMYTKVDANN